MLVVKARPRKAPDLLPLAQFTPSEQRVTKAFRTAVSKTRKGVARQTGFLTDAVAHRPPSAVIDAIDLSPLYDYQRILQDELTTEAIDAGRRTRVPNLLRKDFVFDQGNSRAAEWAAQEAGTLIQNVTNETLANVRRWVALAEEGGMSAYDVARSLRDVIGLTDRQAAALQGHIASTAASLTGQGVDPATAMERALSSSERYADRMIRARAETIARTEIMRASHLGRNEAWAQGIEEGWISDIMEVVWIASGDACDECLMMDGERVPVTQGFPEDELHPNCRCTQELAMPDDDTIDNYSDRELADQLEALLGG